MDMGLVFRMAVLRVMAHMVAVVHTDPYGGAPGYGPYGGGGPYGY